MLKQRNAFAIAAAASLFLAAVLTAVLIWKKTQSPNSVVDTVKTSDESKADKTTVRLARNDDGTYRLAASDDAWHQVGSGRFTIEVGGRIDFGGIVCGPEGVSRTGPGIEIALAPNLPLGAVIAKVGPTGAPFVVGAFHRFDTT